MNIESLTDRAKRNSRAAKGGTLVAVVLVVILLGGFGMVAYYLDVHGYFSAAPPSNGSPGTTIAVTQAGGSSQQAMAFQWQTLSGGGTPTAVSDIATPTPFYANPLNTGSVSAGASNQVTVGNAFTFPFWSMIATTTNAYPAALSVSGYGVQTVSGLPGFSDLINNVNCPSTICNTGTYIQQQVTLPASYANGTTSVTAVAVTVVPSFAGTKLLSSGTLTFNLAGVAARGGGVGFTQCASGAVLAGIPNQLITQYVNGVAQVAPAGTIVPANCYAIAEVNQTGFTVGGSWTQLNSRNQPQGSYAFITPVTAQLSSASSSPQYLFASVSLPYQYAGTTGKDIAINVEFIDNQQLNEIQTNFADNLGITGNSVACTSSATTNMCTNSSDISVGTGQNVAGTAVSWGGGGSGSSTKPSWFMQSITVNNAGWATYAYLMTAATESIVYST